METQGRPGDELRLYVDMNRVHFFDTKTEKIFFIMEVSNETVDGENEGQKCIFLSDSLFSGVCGFPFYPFVKTIYLSLF